MNASERRTLTRFRIEMPISVQVLGTDVVFHTTTRDVSASGVFFYTSFDLEISGAIEFIMTLPPELTHTAGIHVACKGTVLRVDHDTIGGPFGIGAAIHSFDILGTNMSVASSG